MPDSDSRHSELTAGRWPTLVMHGGTRTVTGSRFMVEAGGRKVLVDCGLFQGLRELRARNWTDFPVQPSSIDAVVITHAHLDHCGYLPRLVKAGFRGPVHVTYDTGKLMSVVLPDSARLLEEEARYANRAGYSKHHPALPLYDADDVWRALDLLRPANFGERIEVVPGLEITFAVAGHILGSASVRMRIDPGTTRVGESNAGVGPNVGPGARSREPITIAFSGDLGRQQHPVLRAPDPLGDTDWIVVESTYGDRIHDDDDAPVEQLAALIDRTVDRGGVVVIPAFAVDRTEVLLYHLRRLAEAGRLPQVPIYVDSPMALAALQVYRAAISEGAEDIRAELQGGSDPFSIPDLNEVFDADGSKAVTSRSAPGIIIAGSGMATGGRVVHHLTRFLPDARNSVALVGFQAVGTRGRSLMDGAEAVKIHGRYVPVRAEICDLSGFSVHADASELVAWCSTAPRPPTGVFVVHGEQDASMALKGRLNSSLGWNAVVPIDGERLSLRPDW